MYKPNSNCYCNKLCAVCVACNLNGLMAWRHTNTAVTSRQMVHFASSSIDRLHHHRTLKPKREQHIASQTSERHVKPRSEE